MVKTKVYNQQGEEIKEIKLSPRIFELAPNKNLVYQAMIAQLGNQRKILAKTKDRSEVRGGGKKPWRQKGTGRARHGSNRSPLWTGGGVTFGPLAERNFKKRINKKMKQRALFMVLSEKFKKNSIFVLDKLELKEAKTKEFNQVVSVIRKKVLKEEDKKASLLFIKEGKSQELVRTSRNLEKVKVLGAGSLNIVDLLKAQKIIFLEPSLKIIEKTYQKV